MTRTLFHAQCFLSLNLGQCLWHGLDSQIRWTEDELALLGTMVDAQVARQTGRTTGAVRQKREELGIPNPASKRWAAEEIALRSTLPDEAVGRQIGRSRSAVTVKRIELGIPLTCDRRRKENRV